ncbi:response regulator [Pseudoalteromonas sp. SSDWG2]|uniref:response regulator n=1 Tax=Pseudoalteromonas sp. SSDWG2 TaxID=3139391 RepID=UPI003BAC9391
MRVLVVDDMPLMRHVLTNMLRKLDFKHVDEATNGEQALKMLKKKRYNLVLTDLHMPKISGKDLFLSIRANEKWNDIAVIVVSCEDQKEVVTDLIKAKVDGFIVKPFNFATLQKQLDLVFKEDQKATHS